MALARLASPAAADPYPQLLVDRPLVYAPGMTAVDIGVDAPTYRYGGSSNTRLGDYVYPDLVITHAAGPVQLGARFVDDFFGPVVEARMATYVGPGALYLDVTTRIPNQMSNLDSELSEHVGYGVKSIVVPHGLAVDAGAGLTQWEASSTYGDSTAPLWLGAGVGSTLQVVPEFAIHLGGSALVPLTDTDYVHAYLSAGGTAYYTIDRFDVYGWFRLDDLPHTPIPFVGGGVIARFGG